MLFRQLFDADTGTYTYLLADEETRDAVVIDPVREQLGRDVELIEQLGCRLLWSLDTHVHADHVTGSGELRRRIGCRLAVGKSAGVLTADLQVVSGDLIRFGRHALEVRETPGHTDGCVTYVCHEEGVAFTGDALLIRGCGRTDFQQGDARTLYVSVHERILSLPPATRLYPGHDYRGRTVTTVAEERRFNGRLGGGKTLEEFVAIMRALRLAYPQRMDEAVPANMASGVTNPETIATQEPADWAELHQTASGVAVVTAPWLAAHRSQTQVVDVREDAEFGGPLGHLEGSELVPLATLPARAETWRREEPIVTVCTYGTRSAKAVTLLRERGFERVASLHGGLIGWRTAGYPTVGGLAAMSDRQDAAGWEGMNI
jgi:glyoxylase-like metal-dependent hydrolase (beta-lactamase superfamily II)/rhodanese-related sulfurtransferase